MLDLKAKADLQRLVDEGFDEGLTLEYKASPALSREGKAPDEMCKDVSAMANSAGGQIIYGIVEDKKTHKPSHIDDGVSDPKLTGEWIEQTLNSKVQPRMQGIVIQRLTLAEGHYSYVISVPPTRTGPHQAPDQKYYRRFNLQAVPMYDYEVRDVMKRSSTPVLTTVLSMLTGGLPPGGLPDGYILPLKIDFRVYNTSEQPADYAVLSVHLSTAATVSFAEGFSDHREYHAMEDDTYQVLRSEIGLPRGTPIFKGNDVYAGTIYISFSKHLELPNEVFLATQVSCPGFSERKKWPLVQEKFSFSFGKISEWA